MILSNHPFNFLSLIKKCGQHEKGLDPLSNVIEHQRIAQFSFLLKYEGKYNKTDYDNTRSLLLRRLPFYRRTYV